jgi:glucose-6-phosphate isomerase
VSNKFRINTSAVPDPKSFVETVEKQESDQAQILLNRCCAQLQEAAKEGKLAAHVDISGWRDTIVERVSEILKQKGVGS